MNEDLLDVVESTVRTETLGSLLTPVVGVCVSISLSVGGALGYILAKKRLQPKYEALAQQEIAEARAFYNKLAKEEMVLPEKQPGLDEAITALRTYQGVDEEDVIVEIDVETDNVFVGVREDDFNLDDELELRKVLKPDVPFIISHDEFMAAEPEFDQTTLTYYAGDNVLADERDTPVDDIDLTVGEETMLRFGYGSGDANTVFIRNNRLKLDFEVTRSDGKFAHEVLGLEHSDSMSLSERRNKIHKFRGDNE